MAMRQRAVRADDKEQRRHAIIDAAERLFARAPARVASIAEVADEAGLAKGTVYLYFPSKDALLLAIHERHVDEFFDALNALLASARPVSLAAIHDVARTHMIERPAFLPLASRCCGLLQPKAPSPFALGFRARMAERLSGAGGDLERHFAGLPAGAGSALLRHSYALIVGLWQMGTNAGDSPAKEPPRGMVPRDYPVDLERALRALWDGTIGTRRNDGARSSPACRC